LAEEMDWFSRFETAAHAVAGQFGADLSRRRTSFCKERVVPVGREQGGSGPEKQRGIAHGAGQSDSVSRIADGFFLSSHGSQGSGARLKTHHDVLRAPTRPAF
jgi:hypothetical protein